MWITCVATRTTSRAGLQGHQRPLTMCITNNTRTSILLRGWCPMCCEPCPLLPSSSSPVRSSTCPVLSCAVQSPHLPAVQVHHGSHIHWVSILIVIRALLVVGEHLHQPPPLPLLRAGMYGPGVTRQLGRVCDAPLLQQLLHSGVCPGNRLCFQAVVRRGQRLALKLGSIQLWWEGGSMVASTAG